jgi:hypothetical protein
MTDRSLTPVAVTAVRVGRKNLGGGRVVLDEDSINVLVRSATEEPPVRVGFESVDSVAVDGEELVLALRDGSRIVFASSGAAYFASAVLTRCRALPELTRTLRAFGSRRHGKSRRDSSPAEQQRFFAPLLEARRVARTAAVPADVIAAFDGVALSKSVHSTLREFAGERHSEQGPSRRALEAELEEIAEPLVAAMTSLAQAATDAKSSIDDLRLWRVWTAQVRTMFEVADRVWASLDAALDASSARS